MSFFKIRKTEDILVRSNYDNPRDDDDDDNNSTTDGCGEDIDGENPDG